MYKDSIWLNKTIIWPANSSNYLKMRYNRTNILNRFKDITNNSNNRIKTYSFKSHKFKTSTCLQTKMLKSLHTCKRVAIFYKGRLSIQKITIQICNSWTFKKKELFQVWVVSPIWMWQITYLLETKFSDSNHKWPRNKTYLVLLDLNLMLDLNLFSRTPPVKKHIKLFRICKCRVRKYLIRNRCINKIMKTCKFCLWFIIIIYLLMFYFLFFIYRNPYNLMND